MFKTKIRKFESGDKTSRKGRDRISKVEYEDLKGIVRTYELRTDFYATQIDDLRNRKKAIKNGNRNENILVNKEEGGLYYDDIKGLDYYLNNSIREKIAKTINSTMAPFYDKLKSIYETGNP